LTISRYVITMFGIIIGTMQDSAIGSVEPILLLLLLLVSALAILAKRLRIAYPIVMVIGGLSLSLVPHVPHVSLNPDVVFLVILPPLLFLAAFHISWREFRRNLLSIIMLAFGLVSFTIFGSAAAVHWLIPGFDWHLGLVLGSVIAATDAIAATATAKRLGLPRRITELIEAESLVNDGSGLVALRFTLAIVLAGTAPSFVQGTGTLFYLIFIAIVVGLAVGFAAHALLRRIVDSPVEITISLITPYVAYLAAESLQCSGVLATLACGIYIGRRSSGFFSLQARMEGSAVWNTLDFILNAVVFFVLGLQLPTILTDIRGQSFIQLIVAGALFSGIVVLLRLLWVLPGAWIASLLPSNRDALSPKSALLVGWAGMRGVLALAAAFSLPENLPQRSLMIFLTFCVIFTTLVLQGLSMPWLIRTLGLAGASPADVEEESWARRQLIETALAKLASLRGENDGQHLEAFERLEEYYRRRLLLLESTGLEVHETDFYTSLAQQLRDVERAVANHLRAQNKIHDEVLRKLERELDLVDARFAPSDPALG
jgi:CPA1 family monovalent cation:H+ antiporter